ncbi:MAG: T9SS type A sorting domain-containing protein [Candidatus Delongbacteria bacterium]|nr:T9SS type A sorting domain-containing protein [Candidatus Delongbacteria bacterium]
MVATANGILWSLRCEEAVSGEPVWVAGGLIRRVELVDHRLLLTELNRTRLFHLHEETATAVQLLTSGGRFHLTPDGLLNVTDSSLWWDYRNNDLYINGGTLSLETGVLDGFNYHGRLVILWRDKLRLMDRYGMTLQEIPLEDAARLRRCGENLLVLTEQDRLQLFQPAADGHLVSITEVQLVDLRAAAYSAGRLFMLNPAGIWRADPAGRDPVLLLPLNGGRCLDSWGNSLAVGRVDGVLLLLRYHPGRDELGEESILEGCGRVEQVGFVDQKLVVLRSSGLIIYQQEEPAQTDRWEDSRPQQVITTPFLSEKSTDKEPALRIVPGPVVTGNYVSFELNTIMPTKVSLFNLGGQLIETLALPVSAGELTIPLRGLPAGCYFLQASGNERNEVQRFILIR